eukprot:gene15191-biopygen8776
MESFQPLAIKLSFTGRGTALFRPRERPREGIPVNGPVNDPPLGLGLGTAREDRVLAVRKGAKCMVQELVQALSMFLVSCYRIQGRQGRHGPPGPPAGPPEELEAQSTLLDQLARNLIRRCAGLRPDHPSRLLYRPINPDGIYPATALYAAAIVHQNVRHIATEWMEGGQDRLEALRREPGWPGSSHACPSTAPVLQRSTLGARLLWAMRELGLMLVQADLPLPADLPVAYFGEAHLDLIPPTMHDSVEWFLDVANPIGGFGSCAAPEGEVPFYMSRLHCRIRTGRRGAAGGAMPCNLTALEEALQRVLSTYDGVRLSWQCDPWQLRPDSGHDGCYPGCNHTEGYVRISTARLGKRAILRPTRLSLRHRINRGVVDDDWDTEEEERLNFGSGPVYAHLPMVKGPTETGRLLLGAELQEHYDFFIQPHSSSAKHQKAKDELAALAPGTCNVG